MGFWDDFAAANIPMPELVRQVHAGRADPWHDAGRQAEELAREDEAISGEAQDLLASMESVWSGGGSDAAREKIEPAVKAVEMSSMAYQANARMVTDNGYAFDQVKTSMVEMPKEAPTRNAYDVITPWDTDTEDAVNEYKALEEQNRQAYLAYETQIAHSESALRDDYGDLGTFDGGSIELDQQKDQQKEQPGNTTRDGSTDGSRPGGSAPSPTGAAVSGPAGTAGTSSVPGPGSSGSFSGDLDGSGSPVYPDGTSASSFTPSTSDPVLNRPAANLQPASFGPGQGHFPGNAPGNAPGAGPWVGGTPGATPGAGPGGVGARPGLGASPGPLGPGGGSGAGAPGAAGAGGAAGARPGAAGAAGRGGMPMGGMGGGAGRGQGGDDSEHQRKYVQDTNEVFQFTEDGEHLRDPETGHSVAPPTIGA